MTDLQTRLLQEHHHREDLEVKVLALEKDRQLLEAENHSLVEQCRRSADQQKGMSLDLALLMLGIMRRLPMVHSPRDGAQPLPRSYGPTP